MKRIKLFSLLLLAGIFSNIHCTLSNSSKQNIAQPIKFLDIYIIRHGETDWNYQSLMQGQTDIPLNDKGRQQAHKLKDSLRKINFSTIISSDLSRAYETATIVRDSRPIDIVIDTQLRERCLGAWEGRIYKDLKEYLAPFDFASMSQESYVSCIWDTNIESYAAVYNRFNTVLNIYKNFESDLPILLSSHGNVLRSILYHLYFIPGYHWSVSNCAYMRLHAYENGTIIIVEQAGIHFSKGAI